MNLRQVIPTGVTASAIVHLTLLALLFLFSEVHQLGSVPAETVAVDIVTPQEMVENTPDPAPTPTPQPDFSLPAKPAMTPQAPAAAPQQSTPPAQKQAAPPAPAARPAKQQSAAAQPPQPQPQPQPRPVPQPPAYAPPEPDLSVKYHVMLGLPPALPPEAPSSQGRDKADDNFDAPATKAADIASNVQAQFRRRLMTCAKLPASVKTSDDVRVKLRVFMTPDGKLAADPVLIEASASMKGPLLMQSAISALQACQPFAELPADRYDEWKMLDLNFTPKDFAS
jgi:outer membrane biosynthesis protein TonB